MLSRRFAEIGPRFDGYYRAQGSNPDFDRARALEVCQRFVRLDKILNEVQHWQDVGTQRSPPIPIEAKIAAIDEAQFFTETFYYFAHRALKIVIGLPSLEKVKARGVTIIRNKLLEHPEGQDSRTFTPSFRLGPPCGPVLKGLRESFELGGHGDPGLFSNADEFIASLDNQLKDAGF